MIKILSNHPLSEDLVDKVGIYLKIDKMEMIWIVYAIVVVNHPDQRKDEAKAK